MKKYLFGLMVSIALAGAISAKDAVRVELAMKGDRILLYEYGTKICLATWGMDFEKLHDVLRDEVGKDALKGQMNQAAMIAFMCFIDRTYVHKGEAPDEFSHGIVVATRRLLGRRLDWEAFAKEARSNEISLLRAFFKNYPESNFERDLQLFKESFHDKEKDKQSHGANK